MSKHLRRREFLNGALSFGGTSFIPMLDGADGRGDVSSGNNKQSRIAVKNGVVPVRVQEAILFPFDDYTIPFSRDLLLNLVKARKWRDEIDDGLNVAIDSRQPEAPVLGQGLAEDPDSYEVISPIVYLIDGRYHMWYLGQGKDRKRRSCYALSDNGLDWQKPKLGLVEYNGNTQNNLVTGPCGEWVLYDPEDPNPARRFKSLYMIEALRLSASFSADGLRWAAGPQDILGIGLEAGHVFKFNGCYYVNGQGGPSIMNRLIPHPIEQASKRVMITCASYDFEHWTHSAALSFRRDNIPPRPPTDFEPHRGPQVHEGAAVWDRGNVLLALYGQYDNFSNDRDDSRIDLGFLVSHDALHFREPIPDFKMIHSYEERDGAAQRIVQRNAFANIGDRSMYWYSTWRSSRAPEPTGVRLATWERDRFGYFSAAHRNSGYGASYEPHCISCPIELEGLERNIYLNLDGVGPYSQLAVEVLNERFQPLAGYTQKDCIPVNLPGLRQPVAWRERRSLAYFRGPIRVRVSWAGVRPEDARLYGVYVGE